MPTQPILNTSGLTSELIARVCPSVFATSAHESRSERYLYIPTSDILVTLRREGFVPTMVMQAKSRISGKAAFTKHLVRLRQVDDLGNPRPDIHEIVLVNSHDGSCPYSLMSGVFRCICSNGLITGDIDSTLKVYHRGNILEQVIEATYAIVEESQAVMHEIEQMKHIPLSRAEQLLLAEFSMQARFGLDGDEVGEEKEKQAVPYEPRDFLRVRRMADIANDLYTTMNVVQEHLTKGGISHRDRTGRRHTTRAITSIDQSVRINRLLWQFAERMKELKQS